jgi:fused signal recognition particle receptor
MAIHWFKRKRRTDDARNGKDSEAPAPTEGPEAGPEGQRGEEPETPPLTDPPVDSGAPEAPSRERFFSRLKKGLSKTRDILNTDIEDLFRRGGRLDADRFEELEELLITADIGVQTTLELIGRVSRQGSAIRNADDLRRVMKEEIAAVLGAHEDDEPRPAGTPHVVMVVGVNGVGKTTTVGKLAARYAGTGKKVIVAAADTFRAAAIEQLQVWTERAGAQLVRHREKADPAAVAFDAVDAAVARKADVVLIDTAGRLHTKVNLMEELKKIKRSIAKRMPDAPHETLLVLDATTGQNAISQAKLFHDAIDLSGLVLTKLDGTAKGGIVVGIRSTLDIPLRFVGVGEQLEDLQPFDPRSFAEALF